MALARNPYIVEAIKQADYDVVSHGYRWLHYQDTDSEVEKAYGAGFNCLRKPF